MRMTALVAFVSLASVSFQALADREPAPLSRKDAEGLPPQTVARRVLQQISDGIKEMSIAPYAVLEPSQRLNWISFYAAPQPAGFPGLCQVLVYHVRFEPADGTDGSHDLALPDQGRSAPVRAQYLLGERRFFVADPADLPIKGWSDTYRQKIEAVCSGLKSALGFFPVKAADIDQNQEIAYRAAALLQVAQNLDVKEVQSPFKLTCSAFRDQADCAKPRDVLASLRLDRISKISDCGEIGIQTPCYQLEFGAIDWSVWGTWWIKIRGDKAVDSVELGQSNTMSD